MWKISVVLAVSALYLHYTRDTFDPASLSGKNVIVTGASKGIGKALALQYAKLGANVMVTARTEKALKEVISECKRVGRKEAVFGYVVGDMLKYKTDAKKVIDVTLKTLKSVDQVILNHALLPGGQFEFGKWKGKSKQLQFMEHSMEINFNSYVYLAGLVVPHLKKTKGQLGVISSMAGKFEFGKWKGKSKQLQFMEHSMEINFNSCVYLAGLVVPHLKKTKGQLGVISSMAGKMPFYGASPYSASKYAVNGFFNTLRFELKNDGVPVPITICNLGVIGTEDMPNHQSAYIEQLGLDEPKIRASRPDMVPADVNETAFEIIRSTTKGERELYYPTIFGIDAWWFPLIGHVWPGLLEMDMKQFEKQN